MSSLRRSSRLVKWEHVTSVHNTFLVIEGRRSSFDFSHILVPVRQLPKTSAGVTQCEQTTVRLEIKGFYFEVQ